MNKKQPSGAQKRKRANERAAALGSLMPPAPTVAELSSLTGVAREASRNYRHWKLGKIPHDMYLVSVRGLSALAGVLGAREGEKRNEIDERLARSLEAVEGAQAGMALVELPAAGAPLVGEFIPRGTTSDDEAEHGQLAAPSQTFNPIVDAEIIQPVMAMPPTVEATEEPAQPIAPPTHSPAEAAASSKRDKANMAIIRGLLRKC